MSDEPEVECVSTIYQEMYREFIYYSLNGPLQRGGTRTSIVNFHSVRTATYLRSFATCDYIMAWLTPDNCFFGKIAICGTGNVQPRSQILPLEAWIVCYFSSMFNAKSKSISYFQLPQFFQNVCLFWFKSCNFPVLGTKFRTVRSAWLNYERCDSRLRIQL